MEKKDIRKQVFAQRAKTSEAFVQQQSSLIAGKIFALPQFVYGLQQRSINQTDH